LHKKKTAQQTMISTKSYNMICFKSLVVAQLFLIKPIFPLK